MQMEKGKKNEHLKSLTMPRSILFYKNKKQMKNEKTLLQINII